jgi:hypothetical protein
LVLALRPELPARGSAERGQLEVDVDGVSGWWGDREPTDVRLQNLDARTPG